jgi:hypothetical protein
LGPPNDPTGLVATPSNGSVTLTWNNPLTNAGTSYFVEYTGITRISVNTLSYTFTGLTNGTPYVFRVSASNSYGTSNGITVNATPTPPSTIPGTPGVFVTPAFPRPFYELFTYQNTGAIVEDIQNTYIRPNYTNFTALNNTNGYGVLVVWLASTNGGATVDYYGINIFQYGGIIREITVPALPTEVPGVTIYAYWFTNLPMWVELPINVFAHNANGFSTFLTSSYYHSQF